LGAGVAPVLSGVLGHALNATAPFAIAGILIILGFVIILFPNKKALAVQE
jgi:dipeptide/tripeptide permease